MSQWFASSDEVVSGPYSADALKEGLEGGSFPGDCLVWSKGQSEWVSAQTWLRGLNKTPAQESATSIKEWHYAVDGSSQGPVTKSELLQAIKAQSNYDQILIWTKGMKTWADVYEVESLRNELDLERRDNPRAPISGTVTIHIDENTDFTAHLKSIGAGGFGVFGEHPLMAKSQQVQIEVNSEQLPEPISAKAEIQYISKNSYVGFKFINITDESRSHIMSFIRKRTESALPNAA